MTTMYGHDKIMPIMDMGTANMILDTVLEIVRHDKKG
jgi:hypothetical protein